MSGLAKKRRLSTPEQESFSTAIDVEDALMSAPAPSSIMRGAIAAFAYTGRSTRSVSKRLKAEDSDVKMEIDELPPVLSSPVKKEPKSPMVKRSLTATATALRKPKPIQMDLAVPHAEPKNWKQVYGLIEEMRRELVAPVDTMGCASAMLEETDPKVRLSRPPLCLLNEQPC